MSSLNLDRYLTHPRRWLFVTTATFGFGALFLLPALDSFESARSRHAELLSQLEQRQAEVARLSLWQKKLTEQKAKLNEFEQRAFGEEQAEQFRTQLGELTRRSGCTMRRIRLTDARLREWKAENDDPLADRSPTDAKGETPFLLKTQPLAISVEGKLSAVQELLKSVPTDGRLMQVGNVQIKQVEGNATLVSLDVEFVLFDLVQKVPAKS